MDIDGVEFIELDYNKQKDICHKLVNKVSEDVLQQFIGMACEVMGEYTNLGKCKSCGEYVEEYKLEL